MKQTCITATPGCKGNLMCLGEYSACYHVDGRDCLTPFLPPAGASTLRKNTSVQTANFIDEGYRLLRAQLLYPT